MIMARPVKPDDNTGQSPDRMEKCAPGESLRYASAWWERPAPPWRWARPAKSEPNSWP